MNVSLRIRELRVMVEAPISRSDPVKTVRRAVARHLRGIQLSPGSRIVAAVSGGPDSTVMLDALVAAAIQWRLEIVVAHFHHGIRGAAADRDAAFVADLARRHELQFQDGSGDAPSFSRDRHLSLEDAARQLRRAFLESVRKETGSAAIALGHTRDDQAETVLLNLLRGAGPRGLGGMPDHGPGFLTRPLIRIRRTTVEAYARAIDLPFRIDETNLDVTFTRNRVRRELIPLLEGQFNPRIIDSLARQSGLFREIDSFLTRSAEELLADPRFANSLETVIQLDLPRLQTLPMAIFRTLLRVGVYRVAGSLTGWERIHITALLKLARRAGGGRLDLPGGVIAERLGDLLEIRSEDARPRIGDTGRDQTEIIPPGVLDLESDSETAWAGGRLRVTLIRLPFISGAMPIPESLRSASFDADALDEKVLTVRFPEPGDRINLFGGGGRRKLSDIFIDRKVPRKGRRRVPVITKGADAGGDVLWVVGVVRSSHAPVTANTRRVVCLDSFGLWK